MNVLVKTNERAFDLACELANRYGGDMSVASWVLNWYGIEHYGLECVTFAPTSSYVEFLNMGETHATTVLRETEMCYVGTWGGWLETVEAEYCEEEGKVQCGYCGEFPDMNGRDWREVVCTECGNRVAGD